MTAAVLPMEGTVGRLLAATGRSREGKQGIFPINLSVVRRPVQSLLLSLLLSDPPSP